MNIELLICLSISRKLGEMEDEHGGVDIRIPAQKAVGISLRVLRGKTLVRKVSTVMSR